ncbi:VWA domain-containing protein [Stenotrophomonas sp. 24(2023)]|uniref:VWA domain-containing protein n=1 Tax=Stenotrophomonas sp. 24(2023) TaxID=3068324 RepID=UPI0027E158CE|nr:VWA domain-containing protein [Stenotrophomonas sp. 24(2023)]WMJ70338.1 VWA domain-containing protein [Stenotrophomonas sp. 24(2023)]
MNLAMLDTLHFLRPQALWLLLALPVIVAVALYRGRRAQVWQQAVDAHLLPHLLVAGQGRGPGLPWALLLGWGLAALALAGPSWRQQPQPLWQAASPLLVVLDLSSRITATDLPPSRLLQARAKLGTLLAQRQGGQVGLVVYAEDAYTVAPLTEDTSNVALYLDALAPDIMPADGQRADRALAWATRLLQQAGAARGQILLVTDRADTEAVRAAGQAHAQGFTVSALGLGTVAGAAYRDRRGQIGPAALDAGSLRALAAAGGGRYQPVASDDQDLRALDVLRAEQGGQQQRPGESRVWIDEGYWLLPPLMLLALLAFRRRAVLAVVLALGVLPLSGELHAQARQAAPVAGTLWQRADQVAHERIAAGVRAYHDGDFATAQARFEGIDSGPGWYNLGNALARQGRYDEAITAYDQALARQPGMADAVANRAVVDAARKRKPPQNTPGQGNGPQPPPSSPARQPPQQHPAQDPQGQGQPGQRGTPQAPGPAPQQAQSGRPDGAQGPQTEDRQAQEKADAEQRQRMQQAMQQHAGTPAPAAARSDGRTPQQREAQQAVEAWMRRVPDDPGNLLRAKFQLENERRKREGR